MKRLVPFGAFAFALFAFPAIAAEDFTGKWSGTFSGIGPDGTEQTENILMVLVHKGTELTGTAGPSADNQRKIENGKVDGDKLSFEVPGGADTPGGPRVTITLTYADGHLKGDFIAERGGQKLTAKVDVTRVK
jgi:hypothetical protein